MKLNLGCGDDLRPGYINCDCVQLPGVDQVVDLDRPIPFADDSVDEIILIDVLEHVDDILKTMEELHRVLKKGGRLIIRVPYWNSWCTVTDPTHQRGFHEFFFDFFDPEKELCQKRSYYSTARFKIITLNPLLFPFSPYFGPRKEIEVKNKILRKMVFVLGNYLCNVIIDLKVVLEK